METETPVPAAAETAPVRSVEDARAVLARHLTFSEPWHYDLLLLWAAQGHLRSILPDECCVYLAFVGPKSSGKTTATQIAVQLAGGEMLASGTLAAMIRTFETARVVGIDELDSNAKKEENLEAILRVGNKWSAIYKICAPGPNGSQRPVDLKIGGPKVYNYRSEVEDALGTRECRIEMGRQRDARQIVENLFLAGSVESVTIWLRETCSLALFRRDARQVEDHVRSDEFVARVATLPAALARQQQTGTILLAISDLLGWGLDSVVRSSVEAQGQDDGVDEGLRDELARIYRERVSAETGDLEIPQQEVLDRLNAGRPSAPRLTGKAFARIRRELGFRDGVNCFKNRKQGGRRILRFDSTVRFALGLGPEPLGLDSPVAAMNRSEMDRAVAELGATITYPGGTVADRRTGEILRRGDV